MNKAIVPILLFLALETSVSSEEPTYLVYFPKHLRAGFPIQIVAEILKNPNPVHFSASLKTPAKEIEYYVEDTLVEGESKLLTFSEQIPMGYDGTTDFEMSIVGTDTVRNETIFTNTTDALAYQHKSLSMFIQTDKGIYKPSQTIKFRVVVTNSDLLPHNGTVSYKLTDPDGNIVLQKHNAPLVNGIAGSEFILGRYSTHGEWKISFECEGNGKDAMVTIDEYQLPKFEVEFLPDQTFLYAQSEGYTGKIAAKFTFGGSVRGEASLLIESQIYTTNFFWGSQLETNSITRSFKDFNGVASFSLPFDEIKRKLKWDPEKDYNRYLPVKVKVKDKHSQIEQEHIGRLTLVKIPFKVELVNTPDSVKRGLYYTAYLRITQYDGSRITEVQRQSLDMKIRYSYTYYRPYRTSSGYIDMDVEKDGLVEITMRANNSDFDVISFNVESEIYKNYYIQTWESRRFKSPSNTYIQLSTAKKNLKPDEIAVFEVLSSWNNASYSVVVLSRGTIIKQESYNPGNYDSDDIMHKFQYELMVTEDMTPSVTVIMYFMANNGEIVADNVIIKVEATLTNTVTLSSNVTTTKTGSPVSVTVQTTPGSTIALRAIDRGVILQKGGNDITTEGVLQDLDRYSPMSAYSCVYCYYFRSGGTNAKEVLGKAGVTVMTDAVTFLNQKDYISIHGIPEAGNEMPVYMNVEYVELAADSLQPMLNKESTTVNQNVQTPTVRKNFPETWVWDEAIVGDSGLQMYSLVLPDTTTTWELSAFAVSQSTGLGVLDPDVQIVASRDFFISLTLPPTMVSGEILGLPVTVYNFLSTKVEAQVILEDSEWYEIVMNKDDESIEGRVRAITVPSQDGKTEHYTIRFLKPGFAKIKVAALSEVASDAVERILSITPQGIEKDIAESALIERDADDPVTSNMIFDVNIPSVAVEGSVYGKLFVSGSVMGNSWNNLGNLLRLPSGCGEQTMLSFAPDVFISLYLQKVGLLEGEIERKSSRHIIAGYENELRYQHEDGSFSAFGSDGTGSTWLTAFVVKSFIAARELNEDFARKEKIDPALSFLLNTQQSDGSFKESGYVRHRSMQGGVSSRETMTAYVVIALTEGNYKSDQEGVSAAVSKAREYLEANIPDIEEPFALSVIAYALALSNSSSASSIMDHLERISKIKGNLKYWSTGEEEECDYESWYCEYSVARASDIEMTAYVLLTLMKLGSSSQSMPIVRWLLKQRNVNGGFQSTQDTVMAIQALSVFAGLYSSRTTDLTFHVTHSAEDGFNQTISVTDENAIVLQSIELPPFSGVVTVATTGVGLADVQLTYKYYLPPQDRSNEPFDVEVKVTEDKGLDRVTVEVCSSINKKAKKPINQTGMFVVALTLASGYTTTNKDTENENTQTKMVELVGNEVTGYFDELPLTGKVCVKFPMNRFMKVGKVKPQAIRALDYYKPERMSLRTYVPHQSDDLCDSFGTDLPGCSGARASFVAQSLFAMFIQIVLTVYISR